MTARCLTSRDTEQGIQIDRSILISVARRDIAHHQAGGQHVVIPGKVAYR